MKALRILVVEDEAVVAMDIEERLVLLGYEPVGQADNGKEAIELAEALRPDVVLMDIRIKGDMDGITAALEIRRSFHAPVIFLAAFAEDATLERAKLAEPSGYIIKPFKDIELKSAIEIAHYRQGAEKEIRRLNGLLDLLGQVNQTIIHCESREELFASVCRLSVERGAIELAWIGWLDPATDRVEAVASFGRDQGSPKAVDCGDDRGPYCQGNPGRAIREGRSYFSRDCGSSDCLYAGAKVSSGSRIRSCGSFPLHFQGKACGVLSIGAEGADFFREREIALLEEIAMDLSFALDKLEAEAGRAKAEESLRASEAKYRTVVQNASEVIFVVDRAGRILFINKIPEGLSAEEAVGSDCVAYVEPEYRDLVRTEIARVFDERSPGRFEIRSRGPGGSVAWYETSLSSPHAVEGVESLVMITRDITEQRQQNLVKAAHLRLFHMSVTSSMHELLTAMIDEAEALTHSKVGFFHFLEADQATLSLQTWSTNTTLRMCRTGKSGIHYPVEEAGVWVDCIREGAPVIHNDYASLPHRKGLPPGHAPITRELVVPILRSGSIVAVFGVGNKPDNYDEWDVSTLASLSDAVWDAIA
ncbi:MAG: GAF domain-containing protein, partial [Spirochaetota bacterium]